jgi:2-aminoethylphosphonate-pyruvate transaminase
MTTAPAPAARHVLLCPGPVMLSPGVRAALAACEVGHRDAGFSRVVARLHVNCATVLGATSEHTVLFVTGPATTGIEATLDTLLNGDRPVIVPTNGTFGARLVEILATRGVPVRPLEFGFGQPFDLGRVADVLAEGGRQGAAAIAMTHHETSTGMLNPVAAVCAMARDHGLKTFVDATSSAGAESLEVGRDAIDACVTTSGKCLHGAPGVALVCVRRDWLDARRDARVRSYSLDLRRYHAQLEANAQTPFTPAVPQFLALDRAVGELLASGGAAARRRQYRSRREFVARELARLGVSVWPLPAGTESSSILTFRVPDGLPFDALYAALRERGFVIYGTKPPLAPHHFQVSVMGELADADLAGFVAAFESSLRALAPSRRIAAG